MSFKGMDSSSFKQDPDAGFPLSCILKNGGARGTDSRDSKKEGSEPSGSN